MTLDTRILLPRPVTHDETAFFRKHGWVKLEQLFPRDGADALLAELRRIIGDDASTEMFPLRHSTPEMAQAVSAMLRSNMRLSIEPTTGARVSEVFYAASHSAELGRVAAKLLGEPVRFMVDKSHVKMPVSQSPAGPIATLWHQDAVIGDDPTRAMRSFSIWVALHDMPAVQGTMRFVGQRDADEEILGILDRYKFDPESSYPLLEQKGVLSPPLSLRAGDATVHADMTHHSAPANRSEQARWAYAIVVQAASLPFHGIESPFLDGSDGLERGAPYPEHRFPVLA